MRVLFAAFDLFPSAKGAATRIARSVAVLAAHHGQVSLACLGYGGLPQVQQEGAITLYRCRDFHPNFLRRAEQYGRFLHTLLDRHGRDLEVVHFRDIWSGLPLLTHPATRTARVVFEVNALPSVELPNHYPALYRHPALLHRLRAMEQFCLSRADRLITVSAVNAGYLAARGVPPTALRLIPNTAEPPPPASVARSAGEILYAGGLAPWQGVESLVRACALLQDRPDWRLVLACSTRKFLRPLLRLAEREGIADRLELLSALPRAQLAVRYQRAALSVAPLSRCDRNELQGCSPIKILEAMAAGVPVVASDLAVCRELITHGLDGWLTAPDSPRALAGALQLLLDNPALRAKLGQTAARTVARRFAPARFAAALRAVHQELCPAVETSP